MPTSDAPVTPVPASAEDAARLLAERDTALRALRAAVRDTTRLTRLFTILSEPAPLEKVLDRVLSTLSELFAADVVALLQAAGGRARVLSAIGWPVEAMRRDAPIHPASPLAAALERGTPVPVAELSARPGADPLLLDLGVSAAVWLPVRGDQAVRGVLLLARCRPAPFERADVDLLAAMAYRIGLLLDRIYGEAERHQLQERLRQAEKSESLGRMASAVAHHFNNMLGVIAGSLDLAVSDLPAGHAIRDDLARAMAACARAAETSGLMLTYLGQTTVAREPVDLVATIHEALGPIGATLPAGVLLDVDLPATGLIVLASRTQVLQVLSNLVANAREAVGEAPGTVHVVARTVGADEVRAAPVGGGEWRPTSGAYVCLEVSDSGCGMDAETLDRIFDPFFTTKSIGRGLGLPAVLGIVRSHDGAVSVRSGAGIGTTFQVFWPLHARVPQRQKTPSPSPAASATGRRLVLLADDEDMVREMASRMLKRLGFEVVSAADGIEAVEQFRRCSQSLVVAILDVTMPGLDGWATLAAVRAIRPDIPAVLASGYDEVQVLGGEHAERPQVFLHKPFVMEDLRAAIEKAVASRVTSSR
jgi:signal transduction histidine kinase/CheY-like chemotaxis protein